MPDDATLTSLIRRAISDPGTSTERRQTHEGWAGPEYESLPQWQARAVLAALAEAGYTVTQAAERDLPADTEWGIRRPGDHPGQNHVRNFGNGDGEKLARDLLPDHRRAYGETAAVVYREIGPWKTAPGETRTCRHCGAEIIPCTGSRDLPVCKGWKHTRFIDSMPIGAHYCDGRSINPSAEPREDGNGA